MKDYSISNIVSCDWELLGVAASNLFLMESSKRQAGPMHLTLLFWAQRCLSCLYFESCARYSARRVNNM